MSVFSLLKAMTPAPVREELRARHRRHVLRRALGEFTDCTRAGGVLQNRVIQDLIYGWGNDGWSAAEDYLSACVNGALSTSGPILECGSGLTTVILGIIGDLRGRSVWALEHDPDWSVRTGTCLKRHRVKSVTLCTRALKDYAGVTWYDPPLAEMPLFSFVVCDGPPAGTPGGRYGFLPVMREHLAPGALVLLDDADRPQEREIAARWAEALETDYEVLGFRHRYIALRLPEKNQSCR